jgi:hypothetical protein
MTMKVGYEAIHVNSAQSISTDEVQIRNTWEKDMIPTGRGRCETSPRVTEKRLNAEEHDENGKDSRARTMMAGKCRRRTRSHE